MSNLLKIALLFLLICVTSCNNDNSLINKNNLLGDWELTQFQDQTTTIYMLNLDNFGPIIINFNDKKFEGTTGSNVFFGDYLVESKLLIFLKFGISEVNESEWGQKFSDAIVSTHSKSDNKYQIPFTLKGNILKLEYEPTRFMYFEKR